MLFRVHQQYADGHVFSFTTKCDKYTVFLSVFLTRFHAHYVCVCVFVCVTGVSHSQYWSHLIPASRCQVAEHTEIVPCSHAHIAAIPGADGHQRTRMHGEKSSLRSVSQWPGGPQPGNYVQHGGPSLGISDAPLLNFPCRVSVTAPLSLVLAF